MNCWDMLAIAKNLSALRTDSTKDGNCVFNLAGNWHLTKAMLPDGITVGWGLDPSQNQSILLDQQSTHSAWLMGHWHHTSSMFGQSCQWWGSWPADCKHAVNSEVCEPHIAHGWWVQRMQTLGNNGLSIHGHHYGPDWSRGVGVQHGWDNTN